MKYTFVIAALFGLISMDHIEKVRAEETNNDQLDQELIEIEESQQNAQMDHSEDDEEDEDDADVQVQDDEDEDKENDGDDDEEEDDGTLVYEAGENMDEMEDGGDDDEDDDEDNLVQADQQEGELPHGEFEMLDDSEVNEDNALEMEALMYEYKPHNVQNIGLNENDEEEEHEADDEDDASGEEGSDDDAPKNDENVQLSADEDKFFTASMNGHGGLGESVYERVVPAKFADGGDSFMASMIENYALEQKNEQGAPNGKFFMDEATTRQAAAEVLKTHKKLEGKENDEYLKQYFDRTWKHFDVTHDGLVEVDVMPQFMRFLASDQQLNL